MTAIGEKYREAHLQSSPPLHHGEEDPGVIDKDLVLAFSASRNSLPRFARFPRSHVARRRARRIGGRLEIVHSFILLFSLLPTSSFFSISCIDSISLSKWSQRLLRISKRAEEPCELSRTWALVLSVVLPRFSSVCSPASYVLTIIEPFNC